MNKNYYRTIDLGERKLYLKEKDVKDFAYLINKIYRLIREQYIKDELDRIYNNMDDKMDKELFLEVAEEIYYGKFISYKMLNDDLKYENSGIDFNGYHASLTIILNYIIDNDEFWNMLSIKQEITNTDCFFFKKGIFDRVKMNDDNFLYLVRDIYSAITSTIEDTKKDLI